MPTNLPQPTDPSDPLDLSPDERLKLTHNRWKEDPTISVAKLAGKYSQDAITLDNIRKAWAASGLSPFNPQVVLKHFPPPPPEQCE
ncbi:hypothetical protein OEA41_003112 [Lepraria neglecta]|uniref:Uncharacterized protein n=1 Tax=Lepraria neglecta TaxID=209136 RepID=A0AAE0DL73_9LECA|nr:hypothetical protein OEA41_003112 [Lepraria neglecta]